MITEVYAKSGLKKTACSFLLQKATFIIVNKDLYKWKLALWQSAYADEKNRVEYFSIRRQLKWTEYIKPQTKHT